MSYEDGDDFMRITKKHFGTLSNGEKVSLYTVSNKSISFSVTDYGATITSIVLKKSKVDVVLGYSTLDGYIYDDLYFGATVGRFANRISGASFFLDGKKYDLDKNAGEDFLHGGFFPSNKMMWTLKPFENKKKAGIKCTKIFYDGEQGFPGNLKVTATFTLYDDDKIEIRYDAVTDAPTPVNIVNHSYYNLAGRDTVRDHTLKLNCKKILDLDSALIPTGKLSDVRGTPFDFTTAKEIGRDISRVGIGYDNCYVTEIYDEAEVNCGIPTRATKLVRVAELCDEKSGRKMTVDTNCAAIQLYTSNYIEGKQGKNGIVYHAHDAVCLETQCFPDSPNKKEFPSCILRPGQKYCSDTVLSFFY